MNLQQALAERAAREQWPHPQYYKPFEPEVSKRLRDYYRSQLQLPVQGDDRPLYLRNGLLLSNGYTRVVVGDYGAYVEMNRTQIVSQHIRDRWGKRGTPSRPIKYWWMVPTDGSGTKIYEQVQRVSYADYRPGMFYVAPEDLRQG